MMKKKLRFFLWVAGWYISQSASAQETAWRFINFSNRDGLSNRYVYSATQDKRGYIWLGTGAGLYRHTGKRIETWRSYIDKPGRNISNVLQAVFTDASGHLWLGSINDLQWYKPDDNRFWRPDENNPVVKKILDGNIYNFFTDDQGDIWIATQKNFFFRFHPPDSSFHQFESLLRPGISRDVYKIVQGKKNTYYAIMATGILRFSMPDKRAEFFPRPGGDITNAVYFQDQLLLSTYDSGILYLQEESGKLDTWMKAAEFGNQTVFCLLPTGKDELWAGSYPLFNIKNRKVTEVKPSRESQYSLAASKIGFLFSDRENNLWICSHNGLSLMSGQNQLVRSVALLDPVSQKEVEPTGIYPVDNKGGFLISGYQSAGMLYYDAQISKLTVIPNKTDRKSISTIITAPDGALFAGNDEKMYRYLPDRQQFLPFVLTDQNGELIRNAARSCVDKNGNIYIASADNGFYVWQYPSRRVIHYNLWDVNRYASRDDNAIYPCLTDAKGHVWFTSNDGIYEYDPDTREYYQYLNKEYRNIPLLTQSVYIAEDQQGHKWITTINNGLYEFWLEKGEEQVRNYNTQSGIGLPSDYLYKIKADQDGRYLWISSAAGLLQFDPRQKKVVAVLNEQKGLLRDDTYSLYFLPGGKMLASYFGRIDMIDFNTWHPDTTRLLPVFNSVKVQDKEMVQQWNTGSNKLNLSYDQNFIQFDFSALHYANSNMITYAFMLEGVDKNYREDRNGLAIYSGLSPGDYIFRAKAATADGIWSPGELLYRITIHPPFWKTYWFIALVLLTTCSIGYFFYKWKLQSIRRESALKELYTKQMAELEMKALRAQMNPHFIFNSLNSIQKYILKNDVWKASHYLTRFSKMIRLILDHSNQNAIPLGSELEMLQLYCEMEKLRFEDRFTWQIETASLTGTGSLLIPSMLIQPFVENAIWHGLLHKPEPGRLFIQFTLLPENILKVVIDDDGIGREKAAEIGSKQSLRKKSYGIELTRSRMNLLNQPGKQQASCEVIDKKDEQGQAKGTCVILHIPVRPIIDES
ncbi:MAG: hypothetical protein BGO54_09350 [Sphingobacteriales bacterium 46-32]|nr:MAG: hypothetical protein BGO54_09350 [Sphingobacteriales bacterium 46-32]